MKLIKLFLAVLVLFAVCGYTDDVMAKEDKKADTNTSTFTLPEMNPRDLLNDATTTMNSITEGMKKEKQKEEQKVGEEFQKNVVSQMFNRRSNVTGNVATPNISNSVAPGSSGSAVPSSSGNGAGNVSVGGSGGGSGGVSFSGQGLFAPLAESAYTIGTGLRDVGFIIAGFGLIVFTFMALFNKISWKNLAYIMFSCFVLSLMFSIISYVATKGEGPKNISGADVFDSKASSASPAGDVMQNPISRDEEEGLPSRS